MKISGTLRLPQRTRYKRSLQSRTAATHLCHPCRIQRSCGPWCIRSLPAGNRSHRQSTPQRSHPRQPAERAPATRLSLHLREFSKQERLPATWRHGKRQDRSLHSPDRRNHPARKAGALSPARNSSHCTNHRAPATRIRLPTGHLSLQVPRCRTGEIWQKQLSEADYDIILGVRSSVFLPFRNLGLVIVDEEPRKHLQAARPRPPVSCPQCSHCTRLHVRRQNSVGYGNPFCRDLAQCHIRQVWPCGTERTL